MEYRSDGTIACVKEEETAPPSPKAALSFKQWKKFVLRILSQKSSGSLAKVKRKALEKAADKCLKRGAGRPLNGELELQWEHFLSSKIAAKLLVVDGKQVHLKASLGHDAGGIPAAETGTGGSVAGDAASRQRSKKRKQRSEEPSSGGAPAGAASPSKRAPKHPAQPRGADADGAASAPSPRTEEGGESGGLGAAGRPAANSVPADVMVLTATEPGEEDVIVLPEELQLPWGKDAKRTDVKHGPFSEAEKNIIRRALKWFANENGLPVDDLRWLFEERRSTKARGFWKFRRITAVHLAGTRMLYPERKRTPFTKEEDEQLRTLVPKYGSQWVRIGKELGRYSGDCADRYRHLVSSETNNKGKWTDEEEQRLKTLVEEYLTEFGVKVVNDTTFLDGINWVRIAERHGTRNRIQCLEKWYDSTRGKSSVAYTPAISDELLVERVAAQVDAGAMYEYEVEWDSLVERMDAAKVKKRWRLLLHRLSGAQLMELPDKIVQLQRRFGTRTREQQERLQEDGGPPVAEPA
uniref:Cyclin-d-binding myb-like transcription factor 1 isoform x1 n=1 Tax=Tetraselmis sp. GSL018 TaxID=582737 RepID=A0A061RUV0_9CHLO